MARDARLGLAKNGDQLAHREFGDFQQAEDAQPRFLAGRFEARKESAERERRRSSFIRHKHIFISIFSLVKSNGAIRAVCLRMGPPAESWVFLDRARLAAKPQLITVGLSWISLDFLVRIEPFQWVARDPARKKFHSLFASGDSGAG